MVQKRKMKKLFTRMHHRFVEMGRQNIRRFFVNGGQREQGRHLVTSRDRGWRRRGRRKVLRSRWARCWRSWDLYRHLESGMLHFRPGWFWGSRWGWRMSSSRRWIWVSQQSRRQKPWRKWPQRSEYATRGWRIWWGRRWREFFWKRNCKKILKCLLPQSVSIRHILKTLQSEESFFA